jgi:hypothetical protein
MNLIEMLDRLKVRVEPLQVFTILRDGWKDYLPLPPGTYQIVDLKEVGKPPFQSILLPVTKRVELLIDEDFAVEHNIELTPGESFELDFGCEIYSGDYIPKGEYVVADVRRVEHYGYAFIEPVMVNYPF